MNSIVSKYCSISGSTEIQYYHTHTHKLFHLKEPI